jgi:hypothetical protein
MAHQTSKILQGQTTPRSIGRLMDADFSTGSLVSLSRRFNESGVAAVCSSGKPT